MSSPYELALGELVRELPPRLRTYFSAIPSGSVGRGSGVFDRVGTPRRWLWPLVRLLRQDAVIAPVWESDIPFTVENTPLEHAVAATRTFRFPSGEWAMIDEIGISDGGLVDVLGRSRRLIASLDASVVNESLILRSTSLSVRLGDIQLRLPRLLSPRVTLVESFDEGRDRQHVTVTLDAPLIGRIYEYSGSFTYEVRPSNASVGEQ